MNKAVVVSYNWETNEIMFQDFEGPNAHRDAERWVEKSSFIWRDFPKNEGWTHFYHMNDEAKAANGRDLRDLILNGAEIELKVPQ